MEKEVEELVTPRLVMDEEVEKPTTPRSKMGSNNVNSTLIFFGYAHSIDIKALEIVDIHKK